MYILLFSFVILSQLKDPLFETKSIFSQFDTRIMRQNYIIFFNIPYKYVKNIRKTAVLVRRRGVACPKRRQKLLFCAEMQHHI
jgi:hypothetical protein